MNLTMNTYGMRSINAHTFNTYGSPDSYLPLAARNWPNLLLRINNLTLNILGYIPGVAQISGCMRILVGIGIITSTLKIGTPGEGPGVIIGRWYREALITGIAQVARGILEAFVPFGKTVNAYADCIGTVINLYIEASYPTCEGCSDCQDMFRYRGDEYEEAYISGVSIRNNPPYHDPKYPLLLYPLYLA